MEALLAAVEIDPTYTAIWGGIALAGIATEVWAIFRRGKRGSGTLSSHWWWAQERSPIIAPAMFLIGNLILTLHFLVHWP